MTDLNLNFDTGIKSVTMGPTSNDNISVSNQNSPSSQQNSPQPPPDNTQNNSAPSLSVSDPVGIEFLAKGSNPPTSTNHNTPKSHLHFLANSSFSTKIPNNLTFWLQKEKNRWQFGRN